VLLQLPTICLPSVDDKPAETDDRICPEGSFSVGGLKPPKR
jgi:hypothetical protein